MTGTIRMTAATLVVVLGGTVGVSAATAKPKQKPASSEIVIVKVVDRASP